MNINNRHIGLIQPEHKEAYLVYIQGKTKADAYSTHQPVLIHTLNTIMGGDVLEFGMGWHSTPLMHILCGLQGRYLYSVENNVKWYGLFEGYKAPWHRIDFALQAPIIDGTHVMYKRDYAIAFIDASPAHLRQPAIEHLRDVADYIIVHDTECSFPGHENVYNYNFTMYKHVLHFSTLIPATSLLSNLEYIPEELSKLFEYER